MEPVTIDRTDNLNRCFYTVEDTLDGKKYVHFLTDIIEDGEYPDDVEDREAYEEYDGYDGTSYDITDYTFLYFEVGTWSSEEEFDELFMREAPLVQQYMGRVYDTEAAEYIERVMSGGKCTELNVCDVNADTPCGYYWC